MAPQVDTGSPLLLHWPVRGEGGVLSSLGGEKWTFEADPKAPHGVPSILKVDSVHFFWTLFGHIGPWYLAPMKVIYFAVLLLFASSAAAAQKACIALNPIPTGPNWLETLSQPPLCYRVTISSIRPNTLVAGRYARSQWQLTAQEDMRFPGL